MNVDPPSSSSPRAAGRSRPSSYLPFGKQGWEGAFFFCLVLFFAFLPIKTDVAPLAAISFFLAFPALRQKGFTPAILAGRIQQPIVLIPFFCFALYELCVLVSCMLNPETFKGYIRILLWSACILTGMAASYLRPGRYSYFLNALSAALLLSLPIGLFLYFFGLSDHPMLTSDDRLRLFTMHPSRLALFAACACLYSFNSFWDAARADLRRVYALLTVVFFAIVCATVARTLILFLPVGLMLVYLLRRPQHILRAGAAGLLFIGVAVLLLFIFRHTDYAQRISDAVLDTPNVASFRTRLPIWEAGWAAFEEAPLLGKGPGSFREYYTQYRESRSEDWEWEATYLSYDQYAKHAHNIVLGRLADNGLLGALAFFGFYGSALVCCARNAPQHRWPAAFLAYYLFIGLLDDPLYRINDSFIFILAGLGLGLAGSTPCRAGVETALDGNGQPRQNAIPHC